MLSRSSSFSSPVFRGRRRSATRAIAAAVGAACVTLGAARSASAQFGFTGGTYAQNFDTMPTSSGGSPAYVNGVAGTVYPVPSQPDRSGMLTGTYTALG